MVQLRVELSLADAPKEADGPLGRLPDLVPAPWLQGEESEDRVPGRRLGIHEAVYLCQMYCHGVLARWRRTLSGPSQNWQGSHRGGPQVQVPMEGAQYFVHQRSSEPAAVEQPAFDVEVLPARRAEVVKRRHGSPRRGGSCTTSGPAPGPVTSPAPARAGRVARDPRRLAAGNDPASHRRVGTLGRCGSRCGRSAPGRFAHRALHRRAGSSDSRDTLVGVDVRPVTDPGPPMDVADSLVGLIGQTRRWSDWIGPPSASSAPSSPSSRCSTREDRQRTASHCP